MFISQVTKCLVVVLSVVGLTAEGARAQGCAEKLKEAFEHKNLRSALTLFEGGRCPLEKQVIRWHYMRDGSSELSFSDYTQFIKAHANWPWIFKIKRGAESRIKEDHDAREMLAWFDEHSVRTLQGADAYLKGIKAHHPEKLKEKVLELWKEISLTREETADFIRQYGKYLTPKDYVARARAFLAKSDVAPATILSQYVEGKERLLLQTSAALQQGDKNGEKLYRKAKVSYKDDFDLRLSFLTWLRKTKELDGAKYLLRHPRLTAYAPAYVWKEAHILLRRALEKGNKDLAQRLSQMGESTSGEDYAQAQWLKGYFLLKANPGAAYEVFEKTHRTVVSPISRARFAYWSAVAMEKKDPEKAALWYKRAMRYPSTFYGQLAATKRKEDLPLPAGMKVDQALLKKLKQDERYQAAKSLFAAGRNRYGSEFLFMMIKTAESAEERLAILKLASQISATEVVGLAKEASLKGEVYYQEAYPCLSTSHDKALASVCPALLHAVIRKESNFNSNTTSSAGAMGLTQMLPSTAKAVAKDLNLPYSHDRLLSDDVFNVQVGAVYLKSRLDEFQGDEVLALVSYNAGIKYALEWIKMFGDPRTEVDPIEWVEMIPFGETRNYIHRVLEGKYVYQKLLEASPDLLMAVRQDEVKQEKARLRKVSKTQKKSPKNSEWESEETLDEIPEEMSEVENVQKLKPVKAKGQAKTTPKKLSHKKEQGRSKKAQALKAA